MTNRIKSAFTDSPLRDLGDRASTSLLAMLGVSLLIVGALDLYGSDYVTTIAIGITTYAALGLGLNIVMGYAGLLDMGYAAFFAIGAYASAICGIHFQLNFFLSIPIAVVVTGIAGIIIGYPTLRLRPDYLAIVTIGFGELIRTVANNWDYVGASRGLYPLPIPSIGGYQFMTPIQQALLAFLLLGVAVVFCNRLGRSHIGRAWRAIRSDDIVPESLGLPTLRLKIGAYIAGGAMGALAGAIFAARSVAVDPTNFTLLLSVQIIMVVVLGGLGSTSGVLIAAVIFVGLPEWLREFQDYRLLLFSVAVIALVEFRPQGMIPERVATRIPKAGARAARDTEKVDVGRLTVKEPAAAAVDGAPLLEVRGVTKKFSGLTALEDVSMTLTAGRIVGIIGPNGAGKTTLVNAITGVHHATSGTVLLDGVDVTAMIAHRVARRGVSRSFQTARLIDQLTVLDNVLVADYARSNLGLRHALLSPRAIRRYDAAAAARALTVLERVGIDQLAEICPPELSYADRRRVEVARALMMSPRLLILDEPAAGMNPAEKKELVVLLRAIAAEGVAIALIEHDMPLVTSVAEDVVVLDQGRVIATGDPHEVLALPQVIEAYLGAPTALEGGTRHGAAQR
ncbi:ATP-binding cassette domain-containing protein [Nocardioides marmoriginsengisoli]|uniref:ATP-binding cassette domain-containing protein n=1 Tax=Nocardioides marmoriginsengisoli TaxID=661483 RepID=A0A3N0CFX8_9ACTN|nr:branched-chain amino acid ABC transporter ATP-binding protein/permease [Nocardioides marmoriginsengisoli]RNL61916.1 ATP-binding cassette domain-containing protein [Nocardioides marmoriginsengisoli]